ncbi:hypothetical protein BDZ89DRAFT_1008945 [Hymenopellis radicata]|nr:hypothetical protein BDZ89DRAFT_1008945 [Hymenopellis radicata]
MPPWAPGYTPSNGRKSKRQRSPTPPPSNSDQASQSSPSRKRQHLYHISQDEIPEDARTIKTALELHIRILGVLTDMNALPPAVDDVLQAQFERLFGSENSISLTVHAALKGTNVTAQAVSKIQSVHSNAGTSIIAKNMRRVEEDFLSIIFGTLERCGLQQWAPDIRAGTPNSMYNSLHEHIALSTFKTVTIAHAYIFLKPNPAYLKKHNFLQQLYRNFVFSYLKGKADREARNPGSLALRMARISQLKSEGFHSRYLSLMEEIDAHSDDEEADNDEYHIKHKLGRATLLTRIPGLPQNVPLDWFEPDFYNNSLTVRERAQYMDNGVVLPKREWCQTLENIRMWKNLDDKAFELQFGNDKLALYNLPTEEELQQLDEYEAEEREQEEDEGMEEDL